MPSHKQEPIKAIQEPLRKTMEEYFTLGGIIALIVIAGTLLDII